MEASLYWFIRKNSWTTYPLWWSYFLFLEKTLLVNENCLVNYHMSWKHFKVKKCSNMAPWVEFFVHIFARKFIMINISFLFYSFSLDLCSHLCLTDLNNYMLLTHWLLYVAYDLFYYKCLLFQYLGWSFVFPSISKNRNTILQRMGRVIAAHFLVTHKCNTMCWNCEIFVSSRYSAMLSFHMQIVFLSTFGYQWSFYGQFHVS